MKKLLSILTAGMLISTTLPNANMIISNIIYNQISNDDKNDFKKIATFKNKIIQNFTNYKNDIYVITGKYVDNKWTQTLYKCLAGETTFTEFYVFNFELNNVCFDKDNNLYFTKNNKIYKCLAGEKTFTEFYVFDSKINWMQFDNVNNILVGCKNSEIKYSIVYYKCLAGEKTFTEIQGISKKMQNNGVFDLDKKNGTLFIAGNVDIFHKIYKCLAGETTFTEMQGVPYDFNVGGIVSNNKTGTIYLSNLYQTSIYKCLAGEKTFTKMNLLEQLLLSTIIFDNYGNVYMNSTLDKKNYTYNFYKSNDETNFTFLNSSLYHSFIVNIVDNNNNLYFIDMKTEKVIKYITTTNKYVEMHGINEDINYFISDQDKENIYAQSSNSIFKYKL